MRDRLAERLVLLRVRERRVERRLPDAERLRGNRDAAAVERPHRDLEAVARAAEQRVGADAHVAQLQVGAAEPADAERLGARRAREPGVSSGTRNAPMPRPRLPGCVAANTIATSAASAFATHTLRPLST